MKYLIPLILFFFNTTFGQVSSLNLSFPKEPKITENFKNAIIKKSNEFNRLFTEKNTKLKTYSAEFILDKIDNDKHYAYLFEAEYWIAFNYDKIIPQLIERITNKKEIGLINSADLIIVERIDSGDMKFYGHGEVSHDDLFTIAGRANRLLTVISGEDFGFVSMKSSPEELLVLQKKWIDWFNKL